MAHITKEQIIQKLRRFLAEAEDIRTNGRLTGVELLANSGYYNWTWFQGWVSGILTVLRSCNIDTAETSLITPELTVKSVYEHDICIVEEQLRRILNAIEEGFLAVEVKSAMGCEELLETIFDKFHRVARQLRTRYSGRDTLKIEDEYDVQDLLHALLVLHFADVRPEEWTPSYAGGSLRMDFLLKDYGIVIEVKKTRKSMTAKDLGEQLLIDREKYKVHPDCKKVYCFVYDPEGYLGNPVGIKRDLEQGQEDYIKVFIRPE